MGIAIGLKASSIGSVFSWIMMALGAAFAIPNVLRWYWWRINGWGYAAGTFVGLGCSLVTPWVPALQPLYISFPMICAASLVGTLVATWATAPTDTRLLIDFYRHVRPFGAWKPIAAQAGLSPAQQRDPTESPRRAILNTLLGGTAILSAYLAPMYLVGHWHRQAAVCLAIFLAAAIALYFTWYRSLPPAEDIPAQHSPPG